MLSHIITVSLIQPYGCHNTINGLFSSSYPFHSSKPNIEFSQNTRHKVCSYPILTNYKNERKSWIIAYYLRTLEIGPLWSTCELTNWKLFTTVGYSIHTARRDEIRWFCCVSVSGVNWTLDNQNKCHLQTSTRRLHTAKIFPIVLPMLLYGGAGIFVILNGVIVNYRTDSPTTDIYDLLSHDMSINLSTSSSANSVQLDSIITVYDSLALAIARSPSGFRSSPTPT